MSMAHIRRFVGSPAWSVRVGSMLHSLVLALSALLPYSTPLCLGQVDREVRASIANAHWYSGGDDAKSVDLIVRPLSWDSVDVMIVTQEKTGKTDVWSARLAVSPEVEPWDFEQLEALPTYTISFSRRTKSDTIYCDVLLSIPLRDRPNTDTDATMPYFGCFARIVCSRNGARTTQSPVLYSRTCEE